MVSMEHNQLLGGVRGGEKRLEEVVVVIVKDPVVNDLML